MRGLLGYNKFLKQRDTMLKIKLIQIFMRRRYKVKHRSAEVVQKYLKGFKTRQRTIRLATVKRATVDILK